MAYKKGLISAQVKVHGIKDPFAFADTNTSRDGSTVRKQVLGEGTICAKDTNDVITIIPYHSIITARFTRAESESITPPEDAFCE